MNQLPLRIYLLSKLFRLLPPRTPLKTRIASLLLKQCPKVEDIIINDRNGCIYKVPNFQEPISFQTLINGTHEPPLANLLRNRLKNGNTLVDVGANVGVFTIPAGKTVGSNGCVISIECSPFIYQYLENNVSLNGLTNVRPHKCAAYGFDIEEIPFYEATVEKFGMGSLSPQFSSSPLIVRARALDNILAQEGIQFVDFLKVDVEGYEAAVFRGARRLLTAAKSPLIAFEFCDWAEGRVSGGKIGDAQRVLRDWGYSIWDITDFLHDKPPLDRIKTKGFDILVAKSDN
jgi:FkbM family methyltransferase